MPGDVRTRAVRTLEVPGADGRVVRIGHPSLHAAQPTPDPEVPGYLLRTRYVREGYVPTEVDVQRIGHPGPLGEYPYKVPTLLQTRVVLDPYVLAVNSFPIGYAPLLGSPPAADPDVPGCMLRTRFHTLSRVIIHATQAFRYGRKMGETNLGLCLGRLSFEGVRMYTAKYHAADTQTIYVSPFGLPTSVGPRMLLFDRYYMSGRGMYRIFNEAEYRFYRSNTGPPAEGDSPFDTNPTLPHTPMSTFSDGTWYVSVSYFNGVEDSGFLPLGPNGETYLRLDISGGVEVNPPPEGPADWDLIARAGGVCEVRGF